MAYNVPVVNDGFVVAIKEMRSISSNHKTVAQWGVGMERSGM